MDDEIYVRCCVCNAQAVGKNEDRIWISQNDKRYQSIREDQKPSDGYCPPCFDEAIQNIKRRDTEAQVRKDLGNVVERDE